MRIVDVNGIELYDPNLNLGYLIDDKILIAHHDAVEEVPEQWHYEVTMEYSNGGKDVMKVVDVPAVCAEQAWDEFEDVQRYVLYNEEELKRIEEERNAPKPLSIEERLCFLEKTIAPKTYTPGTWYYRADYVLFDGAVYTCIAPEGVVCVWSPSEYSVYWQKVG